MAQTREPLVNIIKAAPPKPKQSPTVNAGTQRKLTFDEWWLLIARAKKLTPAMKTSVKIHMQATGFLQSGQFDAGLRHFGIKA